MVRVDDGVGIVQVSLVSFTIWMLVQASFGSGFMFWLVDVLVSLSRSIQTS